MPYHSIEAGGSSVTSHDSGFGIVQPYHQVPLDMTMKEPCSRVVSHIAKPASVLPNLYPVVRWPVVPTG